MDGSEPLDTRNRTKKWFIMVICYFILALCVTLPIGLIISPYVQLSDPEYQPNSSTFYLMGVVHLVGLMGVAYDQLHTLVAFGIFTALFSLYILWLAINVTPLWTVFILQVSISVVTFLIANDVRKQRLINEKPMNNTENQTDKSELIIV